MGANAGISVIAVDPAYTSRWGREHWLAPLRQQASPIATGHHAAAVVIGRRALAPAAARPPLRPGPVGGGVGGGGAAPGPGGRAGGPRPRGPPLPITPAPGGR